MSLGFHEVFRVFECPRLYGSQSCPSEPTYVWHGSPWKLGAMRFQVLCTNHSLGTRYDGTKPSIGGYFIG